MTKDDIMQKIKEEQAALEEFVRQAERDVAYRNGRIRMLMDLLRSFEEGTPEEQ